VTGDETAERREAAGGWWMKKKQKEFFKKIGETDKKEHETSREREKKVLL